MRNDRGGVIVGYFTKIAFVLVTFSVVCFDAVSVGVARMNVEDTAKSAALVASEAYNTSRNVNIAFRAAVDYADDHGAVADPEGFHVADDGTVTVKVDKEATTLLMFRTEKTAKWTRVTATQSGRAV